jgi:hypothetical protein
MKSSVTRNAALCFASLLLVISATAARGQSRYPITPGKITALKVSTLIVSDAELSLSQDIFKHQQGGGPVRAGSGAANLPERYLMVLVELTGGQTSKVELTATEGRRVVWRKVSGTNVEGLDYTTDSKNQKSYAIFFIEGDRCDTLKLTARYVGPGKPSSMTRTIEFSCGE